MNEIICHHGIKGMKWGVRRTPEQLGHAPAKNSSSGGGIGKTIEKKSPGATMKKSTSMSDEELQRRINRLNMEERYEDLVARQKAREASGFKSTAKKLLGNAAEDLGRQLLSTAVSKLVDKITGKKDDKFDINDFKDVDVHDMDAETISKVSKWYKDAMSINTSRSKLAPNWNNNDGSNSRTSKPSEPDPSTNKSSSDARQKQLEDWVKKRNRAIKDLNRQH